MASRQSSSTALSSQPSIPESKITRALKGIDREEVKPRLLNPSRLYEVLTIDEPAKTCHGVTKKKVRCTKAISATSSDRVKVLVKEIADTHNAGKCISGLLESLSGHVLCGGFHQNQAISKEDSWKVILEEWMSNDDETTSKGRGNPKVQDRRVEEIRTRSSNKAGIECKQSSNEHGDSKSSSSPGRTSTHIAPTPIAHRTRSRLASKGPQSTPCSPSTFIPFNNTSDLSTNILQTQLLKEFTKTEHDPGHVYIFSRPNTPNMLKIGMTGKTPHERLSSIASKCRYTPTLRFSIECKYPKRLEKLVHAYFYAERRKETSSCGACNDGRGCSTQHVEWFELELERVVRVVKMIASWIKEQTPYVEGVLTDSWASRASRSRSLSSVPLVDFWDEYFTSMIRESRARRRVPPREKTSIVPENSQIDVTVNTTRVRRTVKKPVETSEVSGDVERLDEFRESLAPVLARYLTLSSNFREGREAEAGSIGTVMDPKSSSVKTLENLIVGSRPIVAC